MGKFYLISAIVIAVVILILSFAQFGATCTWYLIAPNTSAYLVLLQAAGLGAAMGGLLVMFWKTPVETEDDDDVELNDLSGTSDNVDSEKDKVE